MYSIFLNISFSDATGPLSGTVPAIVGLFIALTILLILFCFMFKLFTQSRYPRARAYADANQDPPDITVEGKSRYVLISGLIPDTRNPKYIYLSILFFKGVWSVKLSKKSNSYYYLVVFECNIWNQVWHKNEFRCVYKIYIEYFLFFKL